MKTLTIVIPVYNESQRLVKVFRSFSNGINLPGIKLQSVIFVNDGSTDDTEIKIQKQISHLSKKIRAEIKIISYKVNRGKGYAVKRGMRNSNADFTLLMDADMSTPLTELRKFVSAIKEDRPVIIGTRKTQKAAITKPQPLYRQLMGRVFTLLSQTMLNTWVSDFTCGFKIFNKQARKQIFTSARIDRWGYDAEILFLSRIFDYTITEIPVRWHNDERSSVSIVQATFESLKELVQIRLYHLRGEYTEQSFSGRLAKLPNFVTQFFL